MIKKELQEEIKYLSGKEKADRFIDLLKQRDVTNEVEFQYR